MYTKANIFNLALSALLLTKQISDTDNDPSVENKTLNLHYPNALKMVLQDLDLDSTSTQKTLELLENDPNLLWKFAYKYPTDCSFLRRLQSAVLKDNRTTKIPLNVKVHNGAKVIMTNEPNAIAEYISDKVSLNVLNASAGMALAYRLADLSAPLLAGKGSLKLREDIRLNYRIYKAEAQEQDLQENANFDSDEITSEFVEVRTS